MYDRLIAPKINIQVESMRHSIVSMLDQRHDDMIECVNAGIDAAIAEIPHTIAREAKEMSMDIMRSSMETALKEYWEQGHGRELLDSFIAKKFKAVNL